MRQIIEEKTTNFVKIIDKANEETHFNNNNRVMLLHSKSSGHHINW